MEATLEKRRKEKRSEKSFGLRTTWFLIKCLSVIAVTVIAAHYVTVGTQIAISRVEEAYASLLVAVTKTEIIKEYVKPNDVPIDELIASVAKEQKVPVIVLKAIVDQESTGGKRLYNFEPHKYEELREKLREPEDEIRMLASSHGAAHVMGFNAKKICGITWDKLYDTYTGLTCGAKILRLNLDRYEKERDVALQLSFALRDYNGVGDAAKLYSTKVMAKIGELLYAQVGEEM